MVAVAECKSRERLAGLVSSVKSAIDIPSKLETLRQLNDILQQQEDNAKILSEFLPLIFDFQSDQHSPVRKFATQYDFSHIYIWFLLIVELDICA